MMLDEAAPIEVCEEFTVTLDTYAEAYEAALREWLSLADSAETP